MKLELQKNNELTSSEHIIKSMIGGALIGGAIYLFFEWLDAKSHTVPPIIIKSDYNVPDSIEFQTTKNLVESDSLVSETDRVSTLSATKVYKISRFGFTQFVKVIRTNARGETTSTEFPNLTGINVGIWLQFKQNGQWKWEGSTSVNSPTLKPQILVLGDTDDFTLITEQLSRDAPHDHPIRKRKRKYNKNKIWRFGKVKVYDFDDGEFSRDGDIYVLAFDNHYHSWDA